jgi:signal transduction histidine kinase
MCGNVLSGRVDPSKPFFTAKGSFWTNSTTALLTRTTEADRQAHARNRCNGEGYESVALIPLRSVNQVFGLLQFNDRQANRFTPVLISHFERMAESLAIALSRRQAQDALEASKALYQKLSQHLETVREEERTSLARELHDEIGQILTAIKIDLVTMEDKNDDEQTVKKKKDMGKLLSEGIQTVHSLCRQLRPGALDDLGLEEAIIGLVDDWKRRSETECTVCADIDEDALSDEIKTAVFRIVQESLTNVSRYARASKVEINLVADVQNLHFSIADNGRGFDAGAEQKPTSFGLLGMHERVQVLGGTLHVESSPGKGARIEGTIPLPRKG